MTLPASGAISFSQINTELGRSASAALSMNDADVRTLAGKPSGIIAMSDLHGKSWTKTYDLTSAIVEGNLRTLANAAGYAGEVTTVIVKVSGGASSNSTAIPAVETGAWPTGVTLIVEVLSTVVGKGGAGATVMAGAGGAGGAALKVTQAITSGSITIDLKNTGYAYGGGGGGGKGGQGSTWVGGDSQQCNVYGGGNGGNGYGPGAATGGAAGAGGGAGSGGTGGAAGVGGGAGGTGNRAGSCTTQEVNISGGAGGAGGAAIVNSSLATIQNYSGRTAGAFA